MIHPLMFLLRRFIYAFVIVFMDEIMHWGVVIVMTCTLMMLAYALSEFQWKDSLINKQHIFNETTIYILCVLLLCFNNYCSAMMREFLGVVLICICSIYVVYNTIVIIIYSLRLYRLFLMRLIVQCRRKHTRNEALQVVQTLNKKGWY